jgi:UDP-N-acetyl-D-glucosamine dehydrogenase
VKEIRFDDTHTEGGGAPLTSTAFNDDELRESDCIVIVTDHSDIDYKRVCRLASLVVDTRNALNRDVRRDSCARIIRL